MLGIHSFALLTVPIASREAGPAAAAEWFNTAFGIIWYYEPHYWKGRAYARPGSSARLDSTERLLQNAL